VETACIGMYWLLTEASKRSSFELLEVLLDEIIYGIITRVFAYNLHAH